MLFPLPESRFLGLDLLCELLSQLLFLLLELGVVQFLDLWLAKLACLHLCLPVVLIVKLFRSGDQVKHVCPDEERAKFLEVAMAFILHCVKMR